MFYETERSFDGYLKYLEGKDLQYPPHLHKSFEFIAVTGGTLRVRIGKDVYDTAAGDAVLVFPDCVHSMESVEHNRHSLLIFAPEYVRAFVPFCLDHVPENCLFHPPEQLVRSIMETRNTDSVLHIKSVLYTLLDCFDSSAVYRKRIPEREALLLRIFDYVGKNYAGDCTLKALSEALSYHYVYLSRYFSDHVGMTFSEYVSNYRITESCSRLANSTDSVMQIALECGFDSLRSYNRRFRQQMGLTPGEYRRRFLEKLEKS